MSGERVVVHFLAWGPLGPAPVQHFADAYRCVEAGVDHRLHLVRKEGGDPASALPEAYVVDVPSAGLDLDSYQRSIGATPDADVHVLLNTGSRPLVNGWLAALVAPIVDGTAVMAGATGSYESMLSTLHPGGSLRRRARMRWWRRRNSAWVCRVERGAVPFPNPHLRTNAVAFSAAVARRLVWPPTTDKLDALLLENGGASLSKQAATLGPLVVVDRDGRAFALPDWQAASTFRSGGQRGLLVADNRTDEYAASTGRKRRRLEELAWGDGTATS